MAAETGFMIDGKLYETPAFDTFTMDEAQVLYDYCGLTLEDFVPEEDQTDEESEELRAKMKNPGFLRALMHIAYQRENPRMSHGKVKQLVGSASLFSSLEHLGDGEQEDDAGPPASTTEQENRSSTSSVGSSESSGNDSARSSDGQVVQLAPTTTSESDTSSISPQTSSVA